MPAPSSPEYDVFLSHAWADGDRPRQLADALRAAGLRVWFDAEEINDFASITRAVTEGLARSKALVAYYSKTYPLRRACQWELTAAFLAAEHEGDPRRRVLVISPEAGADHIHPSELRDAKFRTLPNDNGAALQELAQSVVKHVAKLDGPLADIHPLTAPQWYGTSPVGSTRFVGRLAEMWQVHSLLNATDVAQITGALVNVGQVSGLGGVGKSLLAEEYALHFGAAYPGGVFWLRAYGNDDAKSALGPEGREAERAGQMQSMVERLGISTQGMTQAQIEGALGREIERRGNSCLWVVDDVPNGLDGEALRRWFAPHPLARTLITTRSREYGSLAKGVDLSVLRPEEAYQLLTSRRQPSDASEKEQAHLLAEDVGRHALALDVTASALQSSVAAAPFADFRRKLARPEKDALELAEVLSDALPNGHEKSIAQTMLRSIRALGAEGLDFLRVASVLAVAPIPASLVVAVFEEADKVSHDDAEERASLAIKQVAAASLAEMAGENQQAYAVHTLVSRTVRFQEKASPGRTELLRTAAVEALRAEIAKVAEDPRIRGEYELHAAHGRQLVTAAATVNEANLLSWLGFYDNVRGSYVSAEALRTRELEFRISAQGEEHPDTLKARNNLAETLRAQGDLAGARQHQEQVLAACRRLLGEEHPNTLTARLNLALTLHAQGDLAGARQQQEQVLAARRRLLGEEHPDTLRARNNLAATLQAQGDLAGARQHQEQVLAARLRLLGEEHPDTLRARNNLAETLHAQGDLAGARQHQEQVLAGWGRILGEEHSDTLRARSNLALTLQAQGDLAGARHHEEQVLTRFQRLLGEEHPDTLRARNNLAEMLRVEGDLAGAGQLQEQVLAALRRLLGEEHPATLTARNNLALTLWAQGDLAGARHLQEQVLAARRRLLGEEHPDTLTARNNLAETLRAQGDLAGARQLQEQMLAALRRLLGEEHPYASSAAWNLFRTLYELGESSGAHCVLERDLLWLLDRDPATLSAYQHKIREWVAEVVGKKEGG